MKAARSGVGFVLALLALCGLPARAGMIVEVRDPRQIQQQQEVIFPHAEVKIVAFEFESVDNVDRGRQQAKALHDQFLARIQDVEGAAIVTFVARPGDTVQGWRVTVEQTARQQKAQIAVWGRVYVDPKGVVLTNVRATLIEPPPGISAEYAATSQLPSGAPVSTRGVIDAPVTQARLDFTTVEGDVSPQATFLSGLVRYYKGSVRDGSVATRWLSSSVRDFETYLKSVNPKSDPSAAAQAHLYIARAQVRLAAADRTGGAGWLQQARTHADQAALLNAYSAEAPTAQAVIAAKLDAPVKVMSEYLSKAIAAAPVDSTARVNAAVLNSARGNFVDATKQLQNASVMYQASGKAVPKSVTDLKESIPKH